MTAQHQNFVDLALKLIAKGGRPVALSVTTYSGPDYDPGEPITKYYGVMAFNEEFDIKEQNDLVRSTDKKFLIGNSVPIDSDMSLLDFDSSVHSLIPLGLWPDDFDAFDVDASLIADYSIGHLEPVQPGSTTIYYEVFARS